MEATLLSTRAHTYSIARLRGIDCSLRERARKMMKRRKKGGQEVRERKREENAREDARENKEKGEKETKCGTMAKKRKEKKRDSSPIEPTAGRASSLLSSRSPVMAHTFRNEPDYWLNPDRGITHSIKNFLPRGYPRK